MTYWWVNQKQTWQYEIGGGFLWSPKCKRNGARNQFYENMRLVREGDTVFSYYNSLLQYIGVATGQATTAKKPVNLGQPGQWDSDGWHVPVNWRPLGPLNPREIIEELRPHLPARYSPLRKDGQGLRGVYLTRLPDSMAQVLLSNVQAGFSGGGTEVLA